MKLPPFSDKYITALRNSMRMLPMEKIILHKAACKSYEAMEQNPTIRRASVFVPLCNRHGVPSVLFTVRTKNVSSHKGHVSFPGGHRESNETAERAALRELREELYGLHSKVNIPTSVIGQCQTIPALTGTMVTPIIGYLHQDVGDLTSFDPDSSEVDHIFTRSVAELLDPNYRQTRQYNNKKKGVGMVLPQWGADDEEERIWGLTAMVLGGVLDQLLVPLIEMETGRMVETNASKGGS